MLSAVELTEDTRRAAYALVEREYRSVRSWETAFYNVASMVGTSPSWLSKFVNKSYEVKEPRLTLFANIRAAYGQYCSRVEQENRDDEQANARLREKLNEVAKSLVPQGFSVGREKVAPVESE